MQNRDTGALFRLDWITWREKSIELYLRNETGFCRWNSRVYACKVIPGKSGESENRKCGKLKRSNGKFGACFSFFAKVFVSTTFRRCHDVRACWKFSRSLRWEIFGKKFRFGGNFLKKISAHTIFFYFIYFLLKNKTLLNR